MLKKQYSEDNIKRPSGSTQPPPPQSLGARVISYVLEVYKVFMEVVIALTLEEAHLIGNVNF